MFQLIDLFLKLNDFGITEPHFIFQFFNKLTLFFLFLHDFGDLNN